MCRLSLRGAREFKKEVKEPFFLDAEGEQSVHAFTVQFIQQAPLTAVSVQTGVYKMYMLTHTHTCMVQTHYTYITQHFTVSSQGV